jgi:hypothetical protein
MIVTLIVGPSSCFVPAEAVVAPRAEHGSANHKELMPHGQRGGGGCRIGLMDNRVHVL